MQRRLDPASLLGSGIGLSGGGTHLGRAIALGLANAGAKVVSFGRRPGPLEETVRLAQDPSGEILSEVADQHCDADLERVLDRIAKEAGAVHGWVNNAYGGPSSPFLARNRAAVENSIESALSDVILVTEAAAERMRGGQGGAIVNVASMYGLVSPQPDSYKSYAQFHNPPAYGAAKAGVVQFTRYAACHLAKHGIRVNCVSPGPFPSPEVGRETAFIKELDRRVPRGRVGDAHELAGPVTFLLSAMSSIVTGHNLVVDGGWTAW